MVHLYTLVRIHRIALKAPKTNICLYRAVLQAPFTPFIVIFCNAIQNCDLTDLETLDSFVESLESSLALSEGCDRIYKICRIFLRVAHLYVEAKLKEAATRNTLATGTGQATFDLPDQDVLGGSAMDQFDPLLSSLGLVPSVAWPTDPIPPSIDSNPSTVHYSQSETIPGWSESGALQDQAQNQLQDWFSGSRYIMGLMENDIVMMMEEEGQ
jgi:hypothetical protein